MNEDFLVLPKSAKQLEVKALDWRHAFGIDDVWAPDVIELFEVKLPKFFPKYTLMVRSDEEMQAIDGAEAYTSFNPPLIAVRNSVYLDAARNDGRARMTFAHEFGHLVLHPGAQKLRSEGTRDLTKKLRAFESAEWQARKFAAYFLLPDHIVRQFGTPREMAACCHVSLQAAEIRFDEVGHIRSIKPACVSQLINDVSEAAPKPSKPTLVK
jgi:Zn-dependent peptidase ImmA (M78 family)